MIKINDLSLLDIAAKSTLGDETTRWIYESIDYSIQKRHNKIVNLFWMNIDNLTEIELDYLLWEYHVDYIGEETSIEEKKELIRKSILAHFNKGTLGSLKTVCNILFGNADIKEWFQYSGKPGYFKISTSGNLNNLSDYLKVLDVVNEYKNVRSWLESIKFIRTDNTNLFYGDYRKYRIKYNLGSTDVSIPNESIMNNYELLHRSRYLVEIK